MKMWSTEFSRLMFFHEIAHHISSSWWHGRKGSVTGGGVDEEVQELGGGWMDSVSLLSTEIFQLLCRSQEVLQLRRWALGSVRPAAYSEAGGRSYCRCQCALLPPCRDSSDGEQGGGEQRVREERKEGRKEEGVSATCQRFQSQVLFFEGILIW